MAGYRRKAEENFPPLVMDSVRSTCLLTSISHDKKNPTSYSIYTCSDESDIRRHGRRRQENKGKYHRTHRDQRDPVPPAQKQEYSKSRLKDVVPVHEWFQMATGYPIYRLIIKSQRNNDGVASKM